MAPVRRASVRLWAALVVAATALGGCSGDGERATGGPPTTVGPTSSTPARPAAPAELPSARTEVAGAAWQGRIVVAGGLTADGAASDRVDVYDPAGDRWETAPALPLGLHHAGAATVGDRVYVAGGYANRRGQEWVAQAGVRSLGPGDRAWREEPAMIGARGGLALAAAGGALVAVGGTDERGTILRRTEVLTPGQGGWRPGPDLSQPRDHLAAASSGGRVYAVAGRVGSLESNLATVESWDPAQGGGWRAEPRLGDTRGGTSAGESAGRPCVAGGEQPAGTIASVECLSGGRWDRVAVLRVPRHGLVVVGLADRLHVIGGGPQPGLFVSTAHEVFVIG